MTEAYEAGQQAFTDGAQGNPYKTGTDEHEDWVQGWQAQWWEFLGGDNWEDNE